MMKKFKYLLLVFVAFLSLNMSAKAATLPELFITVKEDYVEVGKKLSKYDLEEEVLPLPVGNQLQLIAFTAHGNDIHAEDLETGWFVDEVNLKGVTWTSNNSSVATVDSNGLVKTVKEGTATIVASYAGKTKNFEIKVTSTAECAICVGCGGYIIKFETGNGTTIAPMTICKTCGDSTQPVTLPKPERSEEGFLGWYKDKDYNQPVDTSYPSKVGNYVDSGCYDSETTIYAKWKPIMLTNDDNTGKSTTEPKADDTKVDEDENNGEITTTGETEEPTVTPTETNEETKTDVKKEDKGCKLEVYEIVIIACAVVLLITLITVLVIRKKKANKETM